MSYLNFNKEELINLDFALKREIIRSNRAGSYMSTTLSGCNTRKYHGLLVSPIAAFNNEKHVLLSSLDETVIQNQSEFNLGIHRYQGGVYEPKGHKYIQKITFQRVPRITYRVGGVVLTKERLLVEKEEQVLIKYTLERAKSPTVLRLKPFLAFRNIHHLSKANHFANSKYEMVPKGIRVKLYEGFPNLHIQGSKSMDFVPAPDWYYNIEYQKELVRGYDYLEDLLVPGYFEVELKKGESVIIAAGTSETKPVSLKQRFTKELSKRIQRVTFTNLIQNAGQQFVMEQNGQTDIVAGFPWHKSMTRQSFISLPGLYRAVGDVYLFKKVLLTYQPHLNKGLFPDSIQDKEPKYNSADTSLWYIWAIQQYFKHYRRPREIWRNFGDSVLEIVNAIRDGIHSHMKLNKELLVVSEKENTPLTWMNSLREGNPVLQRKGLVVEINALWYNALCFTAELCETVGQMQIAEDLKTLSENVRRSFEVTFWRSGHNHPADHINRGICDWSIRPNMVIAAALDHSPFSNSQKKSVLNIAKQMLLTRKGLRTLSPDHIRFKGMVSGGPSEREAAAHQGTVYPWLLQFFVEAYLDIHKKGGLLFIKQAMESIEEELRHHGIGTMSEMYDGNPPHKARGAISQAWNVAGILQASHAVKNFKEK